MKATGQLKVGIAVYTEGDVCLGLVKCMDHGHFQISDEASDFAKIAGGTVAHKTLPFQDDTDATTSGFHNLWFSEDIIDDARSTDTRIVLSRIEDSRFFEWLHHVNPDREILECIKCPSGVFCSLPGDPTILASAE